MIEVLDQRAGSLFVTSEAYNVYNAEIKIKDTDTDEILYINVNTEGGLSLAKESIHDIMLTEEDLPEDYEPVEFLEEYSYLAEAEESKYYEYFKMGCKLLEDEYGVVFDDDDDDDDFDDDDDEYEV